LLGLVGQNGKPRAGLSVVGKDGPVLRLRDETGKSRAALAVPKDGVALALNDENDKTRALLSVAKAGGSRLTLADETGKVIWSQP